MIKQVAQRQRYGTGLAKGSSDVTRTYNVLSGEEDGQDYEFYSSDIRRHSETMALNYTELMVCLASRHSSQFRLTSEDSHLGTLGSLLQLDHVEGHFKAAVAAPSVR
jgi:hypothetical protein